jgi:hypothetical protein
MTIDKFRSVSPWPSGCVWCYHFRFLAVSFFSTESISTGARYVFPDSKFVVKKSKCAGLDQEISFCAPNRGNLAWLVKGATQLCTSKKECNKLDLTADQYFWLVDHNNWSRWFAISSPHIYANTVTQYHQSSIYAFWLGYECPTTELPSSRLVTFSVDPPTSNRYYLG